MKSGFWNRRAILTVLAVVGLAALAGCGAGGGSATGSTATDKGVVAETEISDVVALAAGAEYVVGENRFSFGLFTQENEFVPGAAVEAQFFKLGEGDPEPRFRTDVVYREAVGAETHVHEDGEEHLHGEASGIYVAGEATFDEAGFWGVELTVTMPETGTLEYPKLALEVRAEPVAIGVEEAAPRSRNL